MAAGGNENVVKIIGVICDFVRDAENDYKATRCNIFGLSHEEYTVLSEVAKVSERLWIQIDVPIVLMGPHDSCGLGCGRVELTSRF